MTLIIVAGVITAGGVAFASDDSTDTNQIDGSANTNEINEQTETSATGMISLQEAKGIALQEADGFITEIELEKDDGIYYYQVDIHDGNYEYEVEIDAFTGTIIDFEKDSDHENVQEIFGDLLSIDEAIEIAQNQEPNAFIVEVEVDEDYGRIIYEIEMYDETTEYDIDIDAKTGEIIEIEKEQHSYKAPSKEQAVTNDEKEAMELTPETSNDEQPSSVLTIEDIIEIANENGSGHITEMELDDGVYEVEMEDGDMEYEIEIDRNTGEIVSFEQD